MITTVSRARALSIGLFFVSSFVLHLLWENSQMPLYAGFEHAPFFDHFWICFRATITGDMLFMLTIYIALAVVHRDLFWSANRTYYSHPATWLLPLLIGLLLAVSMELWAVYVDHRWAYAVAMPMVPVVRIGLSPVMQMVMIPIIVLALCRRYAA